VIFRQGAAIGLKQAYPEGDALNRLVEEIADLTDTQDLLGDGGMAKGWLDG
jgi:hypothetical protein